MFGEFREEIFDRAMGRNLPTKGCRANAQCDAVARSVVPDMFSSSANTNMSTKNDRLTRDAVIRNLVCGREWFFCGSESSLRLVVFSA